MDRLRIQAKTKTKPKAKTKAKIKAKDLYKVTQGKREDELTRARSKRVGNLARQGLTGLDMTI